MATQKARRLAYFSPQQEPQIQEILNKINSIIADFLQPGDLKYSASWIVPSGWLACNGTSKNRADYPDLYAAIKTYYNKTFVVDAGTDIITCVGHGFNTADPVDVFAATELGNVLPEGLVAGTIYYFRNISTDTGTFHPTAADATGNTNIINITSTGTGIFQIASITSFSLPDGHDFIRGWVSGDSRVFGSYQADSFQSHWHYIGAINGNHGATRSTITLSPGTSNDGVQGPLADGTTSRGLLDRAVDATDSLTGGVPRTSDETRPKNKTFLILIKY